MMTKVKVEFLIYIYVVYITGKKQNNNTKILFLFFFLIITITEQGPTLAIKTCINVFSSQISVSSTRLLQPRHK